MNSKQKNAAQKAMMEWLADPQELGKAPAKIECAGSFELHEMQYYIFKYKKTILGKWLLGICGGYEGDATEHCGHVYSRMEEYHESSAQEKATAMVEQIRAYWMDQAAKVEERKENAGSFVGSALLSEACWSKEQLLRDLKSEWDLTVESDESEGDNQVFCVGDLMVAVSLFPPVPDHEAEENAANNYMWPDAVAVAKAHKATLMVVVLGKEPSLIERGKLFVKVMTCCCKQKNTIGIFTSGTVFQPEVYVGLADIMKEDELPIFNWIWFQIYRREGGICCYTYGMFLFGKDEMEVLDAKGQPSEVRDFLANMVSYVLDCDVTLYDGETIGFSEEDKHFITRSEGVSLPGQTLKITY